MVLGIFILTYLLLKLVSIGRHIIREEISHIDFIRHEQISKNRNLTCETNKRMLMNNYPYKYMIHVPLIYERMYQMHIPTIKLHVIKLTIRHVSCG